jgi:hypothetical protein
VRRKLQQSVAECVGHDEFPRLAALKALVADVDALGSRVAQMHADLRSLPRGGLESPPRGAVPGSGSVGREGSGDGYRGGEEGGKSGRGPGGRATEVPGVVEMVEARGGAIVVGLLKLDVLLRACQEGNSDGGGGGGGGGGGRGRGLVVDALAQVS